PQPGCEPSVTTSRRDFVRSAPVWSSPPEQRQSLFGSSAWQVEKLPVLGGDQNFPFRRGAPGCATAVRCHREDRSGRSAGFGSGHRTASNSEPRTSSSWGSRCLSQNENQTEDRRRKR